MEPKMLKQIQQALERIERQIPNLATKKDLDKFATKDDLHAIKVELKEYIDEARNDLMESVEEHKVDKRDFRQLERRVDKIEKQLQAA